MILKKVRRSLTIEPAVRNLLGLVSQFKALFTPLRSTTSQMRMIPMSKIASIDPSHRPDPLIMTMDIIIGKACPYLTRKLVFNTRKAQMQ